ncbi:nitroreductase family protein [Desulfotruncus alcoholivorax]|uniref:nitroreductase family protein n=1 Tax=Desulfotruncus alcoholivorax TaxID=265477 RepID=UPI0004128FCE|nr:nitroreductase family protein [Desulfotruncus alcoholivorax]
MELKQAIEQRRSIRKYKTDPLTAGCIEELLEAARLAPSGTNIQPWRFVVVESAEMRKKLSQCTMGINFIEQAPVTIVCCADLDAVETRPKRIAELREAGAFAETVFEKLNMEDYLNKREMDRNAARAYVSLNVAIAAEHIVLRAADLGLGTCWVMMFNQKEVKKLLELGDNLVVVALIPVGYPDQAPPQRPRFKLEDILLKRV